MATSFRHTGRPQKPPKDFPCGGCWGGFKRHMGVCEKNPRAGKLTCWHHQDQESAAQRLMVKLDQEEEGNVIERIKRKDP